MVKIPPLTNESTNVDASTAIDFVVDYLPIAQPRQRHSIRGSGQQARVVNYTPSGHAVNTLKALAARAARGVWIWEPTREAVRINLLFVLPRPATRTWKTKPMRREWMTSKPDLDNLAKAILDALTGVLYADDAQVVDLRLAKVIAAGGEAPRVAVAMQTNPGLWLDCRDR